MIFSALRALALSPFVPRHLEGPKGLALSSPKGLALSSPKGLALSSPKGRTYEVVVR